MQSVRSFINKLSKDPFYSRFRCSLSGMMNEDKKVITVRKDLEDVLHLYSHYLQNNQILITAKFEEKYKSKYFLKFEVEENNLWELISKDIEEFDFSKESKDINKIKINSNVDIISNDEEVHFKIFAWKIDKNTSSFKTTILKSFINKIKSKINEEDLNETDEEEISTKNAKSKWREIDIASSMWEQIDTKQKINKSKKQNKDISASNCRQKGKRLKTIESD